MICSYLKVTKNSICLIFKNRHKFVNITLVNMKKKFTSLIFPVDYVSNPFMLCLVVQWCQFAAFVNIVSTQTPNKSKSKPGDLETPFSIATTPKCKRGHYSYLWFAPLYPWSVPYNPECLERQHQVPFFESLVWLGLRLNPGLLDHWRTLYSFGQWIGESPNNLLILSG